MRGQPAVRLLAVLGLVAALVAGAAGLAVCLVQAVGAAQQTGGQQLEPLISTIAAGAGLAVLGWLAIGVCASTVQLLRGGRRPQISPRAVHRLVGVLLGVGLTLTPLAANAAGSAGTVKTPAAASVTITDPGWGASATGTSVIATPTAETPQARPPGNQAPTTPEATAPPSPAPTPSAPTAGAPKSSAPTGTEGAWIPAPPTRGATTAAPADPLVVGQPRTDTHTEEVVVVRGDTLWDIAARQLGPDASAAEIADAWGRWYEANRSVIGDDADLILPGQRLQVPA